MDATSETVPEDSVTVVPESPYLVDLDVCLAPIRRVLVYAVHEKRDVQYAEDNLGRCLDNALKLTVPEVIQDSLRDLRQRLDGIDALELDERRDRLISLHHGLSSLDRCLGLPFPAPELKRSKRGTSKRAQKKETESNDKASTKTQSRGRRTKTANQDAVLSKDGISDSDFAESDISDSDFAESDISDSDFAESDISDSDFTESERPKGKKVDDDAPLKYRGKSSRQPRERAEEPKTLWDRSPVVELSALEIDEELVTALAANSVVTATDLLLLKPKSQKRVKPIRGAGRAMPAGEVAISGRCIWRRTVIKPDGTSTVEACIQGASHQRFRWTVDVPWYTWEALSPGKKIILVGEHIQEEGPLVPVEVEEESIDLDDLDGLLAVDGESDPEGVSEEAVAEPEPVEMQRSMVNGEILNAEILCDDGKNAVRVTSYGLKGVDDKDVRALLFALLDSPHKLRDWLPGNIVNRNDLLGLHDAICSIHGMGAYQSGAAKRFAFEEALLSQLGLTLSRYQGNKERGIPHSILHGYTCHVARFWDKELTDGQQLAFEDIKRDLKRSTPMRRVVTGEVGAGKAVVALTAVSVVAEGKSQVLFLSQNRSYAEANFVFIEPLLRELGLVGRVLKGAPNDAVKDALSRGELHVLFATPEDISESIEFRRLGLVVSEEASDWGAINRYMNNFSVPKPDILINSIRPLPAVAMLGAYANFDISIVTDDDRKLVEGVIATSEERMAAYADAAKALEKKQQVTVIFPVSPATGEDILAPREALQLVKGLGEEAFKGARISLFHGAMSRDERMRAYDDFVHFRSDVLVATHPIEAAPTAPRVTAVVVEQAEHFGVARLQRVRGMLSHGIAPAKVFYVVGADCTEEGRSRLESIIGTPTGEELAEALEGYAAEGPDAIVTPGSRPNFTWLNPLGERKVILDARAEAHRMLQVDPWLKRGGLADVLKTLESRWTTFWDADEYPCTIAASNAAGASNSGGGRRKRRRRRKR